ncbi:RNA polymerase sigma factor [Pseudidiomarina sediminum]|uniref:RNA polymerase sigma factor n=1 Tax=Pseudidiomarina sediminum TaxID=431675 RepID=UPI001C954AC5|nr:RNA polymerase sigma factor [Pseudidiomarina sediminum]MBY6063017.1 RNA polymerase sigma factor [Pseudidiomarina sediminum]
MQKRHQQRFQQLQPHLAGARVLAESYFRCQQRAADVLQDSLEAALTTEQFPSTEQCRAWLFQVVRNRCIDSLRKQRKLSNDDSYDFTLATAESTPTEEGYSEVHQALAALPFEQRDILVLREFSDCSYAAIADILGVAEGTVMSRLHRARLALSKELQRRMGESQ